MTEPTTATPAVLPPERPVRWVALGDSMTEGVGDPDPARPNGVRGWADLVAEQLTAARPDTRYANLAVRGRLLRGILAEQLEPCLALEPTLVSLYAGGNDMLRPRVDVDELMAAYEQAVVRLRASGAQVVLFTAFDPGRGAPTSWTRPRQALYNEHVREIADRHACLLLDYWRMRELQDWRYWAVDRLHMSAAGHTRVAAAVLELLGVEHRLELPPPDRLPVTASPGVLREDLLWAREYLLPWLVRRLRGTSSGDVVSARHPRYTTPHPRDVVPAGPEAPGLRGSGEPVD
ncbi:SGNH/GDSL hydrolase family protein [Kocuria sp. M1R5S2]|uniref:SGNH/GDSL hydrolase family protein n=1 Tax=Kocuria rhizosphaerae TaxID=3376285 RepID=UPI0037945A23